MLQTETAPPQPVSASPFAKPKLLMGEVSSPRGLEISHRREAFRSFMIARHLRPSQWAKSAGIPAGEILAFLTGRARAIPLKSLERLASAAGCEPHDFFVERR
jgi:DNA-binding Xre family transcriptional regulator